MSRRGPQRGLNGNVPGRYEAKSGKQMNAQGSKQKSSKMFVKSKTGSKTSKRHVQLAVDSEGDEDTQGDSASGELLDADREPDVLALSDEIQPGVSASAQRLAGYTSGGMDMFSVAATHDAGDAIGGAEREHEGSDDDDYADVENVSNSDSSEDEGEDDGILQSAEKDLISEFERTEQRRDANAVTNTMSGMALQDDEALAQRLSLQIDSEGFGFEVNMNDDPFLGLPQNDMLYNDMLTDAEIDFWRMPDSKLVRGGSDLSTTQKRVRFVETKSRSSSESTSEDPDEAYPDLFAEADDPALAPRLALGGESDMLLDFPDTDSFYDFEDEDERLAFRVDEESDSDDESSDDDSSEDEGDTTDDESREVQIARLDERKRAAGRPTESAPSAPVLPKAVTHNVPMTPNTPRPMTPKDGKGPRMGTFAIDPTRATTTADAEGRNIKMLPPRQPRDKDRAFWQRARTATSSRNNSPTGTSYLTIPSPGADNIPARPFTARSTLGSMFNGDLDILRNNDISGIAEELFPGTLTGPQTSSLSLTATEDSDMDDADINMQDFIDIDDTDSDSQDTPTASMTSLPQDEHDHSAGLLTHFDQRQGIVGSFRRNQYQAKHFSSLASHPAKRASASEYNALQKGRRGAANTPMTPARKKRASQDLTPISSSVAGISKKNASSPLMSSRRQRSRGNSLLGMGLSNSEYLYQTLTRNPFE